MGDLGTQELDKLIPSLPEGIGVATLSARDTVLTLCDGWGVVPLGDHDLIRERLSDLSSSGRLDGTYVLKAFTLDQAAYTAWTQERKTPIVVDGRLGYLRHIHDAARQTVVSFSAFRMRMRKLAPDGEASSMDLFAALFTPQAEWQARVGTGRSKGFVYEGACFPDQVGRHFASVSWFLHVVGKSELKSTVHSRLKNGWTLDDAIREPVLRDGGAIYLITCRPTNLKYVGLTVMSLDRRFHHHTAAASAGSGSLLHEAIRAHGPDNFVIELLEPVSSEDDLPERERHWIAKLDTIHPNGLNILPGGQIGGGLGKRITYSGRTYPSIAKAAREVARSMGVPVHVAQKRIVSNVSIPERPRAVQKHPDASGSSPLNDLWRIHKSLVRRVDMGLVPYGIADEWRNYDRFKSDVLPSRRTGLVLAQMDDTRPIGPDNFLWIERTRLIKRTSGRPIQVNGKAYSTIRDCADVLGISVSTLKYRLNKGIPPEMAVSMKVRGKG